MTVLYYSVVLSSPVLRGVPQFL